MSQMNGDFRENCGIYTTKVIFALLWISMMQSVVRVENYVNIIIKLQY